MGQKVDPRIFRIGIINTWKSRWVSFKEYPKFLKQDVLIRNFLLKKLKEALIDYIEIERSSNKFIVKIHATRPGVIIGRGGAGIEDLKKEIQDKILKKREKVDINIEEVKKPMLSARIVSQSIAFDLEKRMPFRKIMKQAISKVTKEGALGVKVTVAGRLNGSEIARSETLSWGKLPLHTLRSDVDFCKNIATMTYGILGIKVWVYKGEVFKK